MARRPLKTAHEAAEILGVSLAEILEADGKATASDSKVSMTRVKGNLKKISNNEVIKTQLNMKFFEDEVVPASEQWHAAQKAEAEPQSEPEPKAKAVPKPKPRPRPKLESKPRPKPKPKAEPEVKPEPKPETELEPEPEPEPIDGLLEQMAQLGF